MAATGVGPPEMEPVVGHNLAPPALMGVGLLLALPRSREVAGVAPRCLPAAPAQRCHLVKGRR